MERKPKATLLFIITLKSITMETEFIYLTVEFRTNLESIFKQLLISLSDCHYMFNIKGTNFKHRVSGLEGHITTFNTMHIKHHNSLNLKELTATVIYVENVLSEFTCGSHSLEIRLYNSIFYCKHQLIQLIQAIQKDSSIC